jgi:hypothetical protein
MASKEQQLQHHQKEEEGNVNVSADSSSASLPSVTRTRSGDTTDSNISSMKDIAVSSHHDDDMDDHAELDAEVREHNNSADSGMGRGSGSGRRVSSVNEDELESSGLNRELAKQLYTRNVSGESLHYTPSSSTHSNHSRHSSPLESVMKEISRPTVISPSTTTSNKSSPTTSSTAAPGTDADRQDNQHEQKRQLASSPVFDSDAEDEDHSNGNINSNGGGRVNSIYGSAVQLSPAQRASIPSDEAIPDYVLDRVRSNLQSQRSNELLQFAKRRSDSFHTPRVSSINSKLRPQQQALNAPHSADLAPLSSYAANLARHSRRTRARSVNVNDMIDNEKLVEESRDSNASGRAETQPPVLELPVSEVENARSSEQQASISSSSSSHDREARYLSSNAVADQQQQPMDPASLKPMNEESNLSSQFSNTQLNDNGNSSHIPTTFASHRFVVEDLEPSPQPSPVADTRNRPQHSQSDTKIVLANADKNNTATTFFNVSAFQEQDHDHDDDDFGDFATSTSTPSGKLHSEQARQRQQQDSQSQSQAPARVDEEWGDDFSFSHANEQVAASGDMQQHVDEDDWEAFPSTQSTAASRNQPQPAVGGIWSLDTQQRAEQLAQLSLDTFPLSQIDANASTPSLTSSSVGTSPRSTASASASACCEASQKFPSIWSTVYCQHCGKERSRDNQDDPYARRLDSWQRSYFHKQLMKTLGIKPPASVSRPSSYDDSFNRGAEQKAADEYKASQTT